MSSLPLFKRKKASAWSRTRLSKVPKTKVEKIIRAQAIQKKLELKYVDTNSNGVFNTTGSTVLLNGIAEGNENNQRNGRLCMIKSVYIKGYLQSNAPYTGDDLGEIRIYWHKDPLGTTPSTASWFQGSNISSLALNNVDNEDSVICLGVIKCTSLDSSTGTSLLYSVDNESGTVIERYIKINQQSRWNNTTAISPVSGGLYAVFVGAAAVTNGPMGFNVVFRVRYSDI